MSWWRRLIGKSPPLEPALRERVQRYLGGSEPEFTHDFGSTRFIVVDVETTGLRPHRDRLISIGAVSVLLAAWGPCP